MKAYSSIYFYINLNKYMTKTIIINVTIAERKFIVNSQNSLRFLLLFFFSEKHSCLRITLTLFFQTLPFIRNVIVLRVPDEFKSVIPVTSPLQHIRSKVCLAMQCSILCKIYSSIPWSFYYCLTCKINIFRLLIID